MSAEVARLGTEAQRGAVSPADHILRHIARRLRADQVTSNYAGQVLVAAAETIELETG